MITGAGIPRQGNRIVAGDEDVGEVTSGTMSPSLEVGIGMGYVRRDLAEPGTAIEIDVRGKRRAGRDPRAPALLEGLSPSRLDRFPPWPTRAIRTIFATTRSTTGRASRATSATFGVTWYAQDALGEVVFYEPPEVGKEVKKDEAYAEVESVKAVSDVYAPLSGEVTEVNAALARTRRRSTRTPTARAGWSR